MFANLGNLELKFRDICADLNIDLRTQKDAFAEFLEIYNKFSLEGDQMHWLCCALYVACQQLSVPTVAAVSQNSGDDDDGIIVGNCLRLNHLLCNCRISIYEFMDKVKRWSHMTEQAPKLHYRISRLERKFSLTIIIFQNYKEIFTKLYHLPVAEIFSKDNVTTTRTATAMLKKFDYYNLYDMSWLLFLCAKNEIPKLTTDLVSSYHLLICCLDLVYRNVLAEQRHELINRKFTAAPPNWHEPGAFDPVSLSTYCSIDALCNISDATRDDAKLMKKKLFKNILTNFLAAKIIRSSNEETLLDILSETHFWHNLKSLNKSYEHYMLSVGDFDERVMPNYAVGPTKAFDTLEPPGSSKKFSTDRRRMTPKTNFKRHRYMLPTKPKPELQQMFNWTSVKQLQGITNENLPQFKCADAGDGVITSQIKSILSAMSQKFSKVFDSHALDDANHYFGLAQSLFYYLLEKIVCAEMAHKPVVSLAKLLDQPILTACLLACCVELVLFAESIKMHEFPWVLGCFGIESFHFYKIIELVVLHHDGLLTRELIKHLNCIEEMCLEAYIWRKSSLIWQFVQAEDVSMPLPDYQAVKNNICIKTSGLRPVTKKNCVRSLWGGGGGGDKSNKQLRKKDTAETSCEKRRGSLKLFLRKFYKLAWLRLHKLCSDLELRDYALLRIWSIFEHSITHFTFMMQEHHLDQLVMCAVYIYLRVKQPETTTETCKTFVDIIKHYRTQPQAKSQVYRHVLLLDGATPSENPEFGDLISFYNRNYVAKMSTFVLNDNFATHRQETHTPKPSGTCTKRISPRHYLYVSYMEKSEASEVGTAEKPKAAQLTYKFNESPGKCLHLMNDMVRGKCRKRPNILKRRA